MDDMISRQAAIDALEREKTYCTAYKDGYTQTDYFKQYNMGLTDGIKALNKLPSAQPEVHDRNVGEWDMFELITSVWYGKQCYFVEENGVVYSRVSCKYMSVDEAIKEFLGRIGDNG